MGNRYLDLFDEEKELTQKELEWFEEIKKGFEEIMLDYLGFIIPIHNRDHFREMERKHREAMGIYYSKDKSKPVDAMITIDNLYIHDMYECTFSNAFNLYGSTLDRTISHEIAHALVFRHGKKHTKLTDDILSKYRQVA